MRHFPTLLISILLLVNVSAIAQTESDNAPQPDMPIPASEPPIPRELKPPVYYLRSEQGEPIYVPDFSFERWEKLTRLERDLLPPSPPAFSFLDTLTLKGEANDQYVLFDASCRIRLSSTRPPPMIAVDPEWSRIPLRFNQSIWIPAYEHIGEGDTMWTYEQEGEGNVIWLRAEPGSEHQFRWKMKVPLIVLGDEWRLHLRSPPTGIHIELLLPRADLQVTASEPSENIVSQDQTAEKQTQLSMESVGGDLQVSWRVRDRSPPVLEATGTGTIRLIGRQIESITMLKVRSLGRPVDGFLVRLPPATELVPLPVGETTIELVADTTTDSSLGPLVRVTRRDGQASGEFEVNLQALRPISASRRDDEQIETAGFEVIDAVRQSGTVAFEVEGDWTVDWFPGPYVRQVAGNAAPLGQDRSTARFVYNRQPYSLRVGIKERESRLSVEPTYLLDVDREQVNLEARLNYRISGAGTGQLRVALGDWMVDRVLPAEFVDSYEQDASNLFIVLSPNARTFVGSLELRVLAHQSFDLEETLNVRFPRPIASTDGVNGASTEHVQSAPANVAVISTENIQLVPNVEQTQGLIPESLPATIALPVRQQAPLTFREDVAVESPVFAADVLELQQAVSVTIRNELRVGQEFVDIKQVMDYRVEYEELGRLLWNIPALLLNAESWDVTLDGERLVATVVDDQTDEDSTASGEAGNSRDGLIDSSVDAIRQLQVELPMPRLGEFQVVLQFRVPWVGQPQANQSGTIDIVLVQPSQDELTTIYQNTLRVFSSELWDAKVEDERWEVIADATHTFTVPNEPIYRMAGPVDRVKVSAVNAHSQTNGRTALEKVWIQTLLSDLVRRDRVSYRLFTDDSQLNVRLPEGAEDVSIAVNGRDWQDYSRDANQVRIELGTPTSVRELTLELWYWFSARGAPIGKISIDLPSIAEVDRAERIFWQLIVPETEHLLWSPTSLTPEYTWQWRGLNWGRQPNREQTELETTLAASRQDPAPERTNRYLLSSVGPMRSIELFTASRTFLVAGCSAVILVFGLIWFYIPLVRHPVLMMCTGVGLMVIGLLATELAILVAQAAVFGSSLVLVARILQWAVGRRAKISTLAPTVVHSQSDVRLVSPRVDPGSSRLPTTVTPAPYQPAAETEP